MSGLFSTFNVAMRGMSVQQSAINVTSHNIANANTEGFSRQKAVIETSRPFGMPTLNNASEVGQVGTGALVSSIERIRDTFLDYQIRTETSTLGQFQARDNLLGQVEKIFNEPSGTGLSSLLGKFYDSWQQLSTQPQSSTARTVVAQQSSALANSLNHNFTQLTMVKQNTQAEIKTAVFDVNSILNQVDQLNQQIIGVQVSGNQPNDLMDKRDLLLDTLSSKFNIKIDKQNFSGNDVSPLVDANTAPNNPNVVQSLNNSNVNRFSYISSIVPSNGNPIDPNVTPNPPNPADPTNLAKYYSYAVTYYKNGDMTNSSNAETITVTSNTDIYKNLDETRVLWADKNGDAIVSTTPPTEGLAKDGAIVKFSDLKIFQPVSGEIKGYMSVQQDTDNYIDQMNKMAKALAFSVNALHSASATNNGKLTKDPITGIYSGDTMPFFVNSSTVKYDANNKVINLTVAATGVLATEQEITAGNISVNQEIMSNVTNINVQTDTNSGPTDGKRALAIAQLRDNMIKIQDIGTTINSRDDLLGATESPLSIDRLSLLNNKDGTKVDNFFKDIIAKLGIQEQNAKSMVTNQQSVLASIEQSKESVSGVSLDEEMANLVQFQHAYQANAKIISTIDQLLDVVINGLKR